MNWGTIVSLLQKGSGATSKFFTTLSALDDFGTTLVAMANTQGGTIIIGFDPRNYHLVGCDFSNDWFLKANTHTNTPIPFTFETVIRNEKTIVAITVTEQKQKPYFYKNTYYVMENDNPIVTQAPAIATYSEPTDDETITNTIPHSEIIIEENTNQDTNSVTFEITLPDEEYENASELSPTTEENQYLEEEQYLKEEQDLEEDEAYIEEPLIQNTIAQTEEKTESFITNPEEDITLEESSLNTNEILNDNWDYLETTNANLETEETNAFESIIKQEENRPETAIQSSQLTEEISYKTENSTYSYRSQDTPSFRLMETTDVFPDMPEKATYEIKPAQSNVRPQVLFNEGPTKLNKRQESALEFIFKEKAIQNKKYRELFQVSHKTAHLELVAMVDNGLIQPSGAGRSTCYVLAQNTESQSF